jgi:L-ascorbate metabolism protein UlaG (beta-lactamase superfamily)
MIRFGTALLTIGSLVGLLPAAEEPSTQVTYIANEGFLIETRGKKILIDALFYGEMIDWCDAPTAAMREQMESAGGPFEAVDLILVTHRHVDHFNPEVVVRHMASNPDGIVVGPPQVISELRAETGWTEKLENRVREVNLDLFGARKLTVRGIEIHAHRIRHGAYPVTDPQTGKKRNKHEAVENLAYLVETGGVKFIHFGDAFLRENQEYFDGERFAKQEIDLVFMEGWSEESLAIVREWMSPGKVVFMHMPADTERTERIAGHVGSKLPNAVVFRTPLEKQGF